MTETKERLSKQGTLLGPKNHSKWMEWRATRDNRIKSPRRLKTVKDSDKSDSTSTSAEAKADK